MVSSARAMVKAIIAGEPPREVLRLASRRLKASRAELFDALHGELTASHRFVLDEPMRHIEEFEAPIARFDDRLLDALQGERNTLALLQTLPGVDLIGAAMLLVVIGADMYAFGSADRLASWVGGQTQIRTDTQRQSLCLAPALRVRSCRQSYPVGVHVEVPVAHRAARLQTHHRGPGAQNLAHDLLHAQTPRLLPGLGH